MMGTLHLLIILQENKGFERTLFIVKRIVQKAEVQK